MKLKMNGEFAEVKDGKPVYIDDGGQEIPYDVPAAMNKIKELNAEAKDHRLKAKEATEKLTAFSGIEDPAAALEAITFKANMTGKKVVDEEVMQKQIAAAIKPLQEKLNASEKVIADKDGHIYKLEVSNRFASSQYIKENLVLPPDIAEATFGKAFKIENGKVLAYDSAGNQIFSKLRPGEPADFEEAMASMIEAYPAKDAILKSKVASGSGAQGAQRKGSGETLTLTAFNDMNAKDRSAFMARGGTLKE